MVKIKSFILRNYQKYPKSETIDLYKIIYQASLGVNHILTNNAKDYLVKESENTNKQNDLLYEYISDKTVRINLYPFLNYYDVDTLFELFKNCNSYDLSKLNEYALELKEIFPFSNRIIDSLNNMVNNYNINLSHSQIYKNHYNAAYRIANSFDLTIDMRYQKLKMFIEKVKTDKQIIICVEGKCASGKTTITKMLDATVISADDFYPTNSNAPLDFEKLTNVLEQIKSGEKTINYTKKICKTNTLENKTVEIKDVVIIEGVYSYTEILRKYYDYLVYFNVDEDTQLQRLQKRESKESLQTFINKWMVRENSYYETYDFILHSDIII